MNQERLNFARAADTSRAQQYAEQVIDLLADGSWRRAKAICAAIPGLTDRSLRLIAEDSDGRLVSTNAGYKLVEYVTPAEINRFAGRQLAQMRHTQARLTRTMKRWHQRKGAAA